MKILVILVSFCFAFFLYVRYLEKKTIFYPDKNIEMIPTDYHLEYADVHFLSGGNKLHGWWIPKDGATHTIIYLHGNAGNISGRLEKVSILNALGVNVFIFDYRGYGLSEGSPSEEGLYEDADAAYDYLIQERKLDPNSIVIYGASLGGAPAVDLASKVDCGALILNSTFTSGVDMGKHIYPFIPSFLVNIKLDSVSKIKNITVPKLFIHSVDDKVVPFVLGEKLFNAAAEPKRFERMVGDHVNAHFYEYDRYKKVLGDFLKGLAI